MQKELSALFVVCALAFGLGACMDQGVLAKPPGQYSSSTTETDANGTTVSQKSDEDVYVDANGNKKAVVSKKTTTDPRGLFNKSTSTSTKVVGD